ncbi:hypothetical protein M0R45_030374 [Rubus argutus]|uniref:Secreted protein n=1 Tax=Rubus argutus TaxID=59490 RepID=A0AAW1WCZ3_RUBAR
MPSSHLLYLFLIFFFPVWACCNGGAWRRCTSDGELSTGCLLIWSCCKVDWAEDAGNGWDRRRWAARVGDSRGMVDREHGFDVVEMK